MSVNLISSRFISQPGVRDNAAQFGLPPMQLHQQIENLAALLSRRRGVANRNMADQNNKRKRPELDRDEHDMEVDEDGKDFIFTAILHHM